MPDPSVTGTIRSAAAAIPPEAPRQRARDDGPDPRRNRGIRAWHDMRQRRKTGGGPGARRIPQMFDYNRYLVPPLVRRRIIRRPRPGDQNVTVAQRDNWVQRRWRCVGPVPTVCHDLERCHLARRDRSDADRSLIVAHRVPCCVHNYSCGPGAAESLLVDLGCVRRSAPRLGWQGAVCPPPQTFTFAVRSRSPYRTPAPWASTVPQGGPCP